MPKNGKRVLGIIRMLRGARTVPFESPSPKPKQIDTKNKMKTKTRLIPLITLALFFAIANTASANFFQGFENNVNFWDLGTPTFPAPLRVPSGTGGINAHAGGYYAQVPGVYELCNNGGSSYTNWGGYSISFPTGGWTTDLWIYLNTTATTINDTRFDWIASSVNDPTCLFRRDFVFNGGFYNDTVPPGTGDRFVISAGNNSGRCNSFPKNPGHDPIVITTTGWYKFEGEFNDDGGFLSVTMRIFRSDGTLVHEWAPLSDPSDIIGATVGGNRYGWFATQEFSPYLAIDDSSLTGVQFYCEAGSGPAASIGYWMNHPDAWCDETSIEIGGVIHTKAQAISLMRTPTNRDMTYQMFAQLVAAEMNVNCLDSNESCVKDAIEAAESFMETHGVGSLVRANSSDWKAVTWAYNTLVNYNEGLLCAPPIQ